MNTLQIKYPQLYIFDKTIYIFFLFLKNGGSQLDFFILLLFAFVIRSIHFILILYDSVKTARRLRTLEPLFTFVAALQTNYMCVIRLINS